MRPKVHRIWPWK